MSEVDETSAEVEEAPAQDAADEEAAEGSEDEAAAESEGDAE